MYAVFIATLKNISLQNCNQKLCLMSFFCILKSMHQHLKGSKSLHTTISCDFIQCAQKYCPETLEWPNASYCY